MRRRTVTETLQERTGHKRRWLTWLVRVAVAMLLLSLLFARIDVKGVLAALRDIDITLWSLAVFLSFVFRSVLSYQMSLGLPAVGMDATVRQLLKITLIAGFYALVLPGALLAGGAASWYKLSRYGDNAMESAALVVYFRIINTLTLLGVGLVAICLDSRSWTEALWWPAFGIFMACLFLFLPFISWPAARLVAGVTEFVLRSWRLPVWLQRKVREGRNAIVHFQVLNTPQVLQVFALSMVANAVAVFAWYLLAEAIGIQLPLPVVAWLSSLLWIIQMIPISIGGLGLREVSLVAVLHVYGIAEAQAVSYSLAIFSLMVVSGLVGGILELQDILFSARKTEGASADGTIRQHSHEVQRCLDDGGSPNSSSPGI